MYNCMQIVSGNLAIAERIAIKLYTQKILVLPILNMK